jgi:hypothetical protein
LDPSWKDKVAGKRCAAAHHLPVDSRHSRLLLADAALLAHTALLGNAPLLAHAALLRNSTHIETPPSVTSSGFP